MIKVLVVDDDKLAHKGLISVMPWNSFNMAVVGEAYNGKKALEFLESNEVDLMLCDLAMPVMSGIELMRIAHEKYPELHIAVLTLHQNFEYIQEALRLGAIDYIAKTQLEKERFEEVLGRIHDRIIEEENKVALAQMHKKASIPFYVNSGYVLISRNEQPDLEWIHNAVDSKQWNPVEIGNGLWLWVPENEVNYDEIYDVLSKIIADNGEWMILRINGLKGQNRSVVNRILRRYRQKGFFYDYNEGSKIINKSLHELGTITSEISEQEIMGIKKQWLTFKWIQDEVLFQELLNKLKEMRLPSAKIIHLLYDIAMAWNQVYQSITEYEMEPPEVFHCWQEVEEWFRIFYKLSMAVMNKQPYSPEVVQCVMEAVRIAQEEMDQQVYAVEVAKRVNMSRSYFSQCFKDIIGKSFNDYLRFIRIEKAKEYLLQTDQLIQWIAEKAGYMDVKYFSHVFREQTGMLPSKYRLNRGEGRDVFDK